MPQQSRRRRLIAYSAVGLFLLIDAVLITSALTSTSVDAAVDASSTTAASAFPTASPTPSPAVIPTPTRTPSPAVAPVPASRLLSAVSNTAAWRATTGPCPATAASPELSTDSGASWTASNATAPTGVTGLQAITAQSESVAEFVGLDDADCAPQFVKTFIGGDNYSSYPDELDAAWYVDPADRATVHGPDGLAPAPCDAVVTLAASSADADSAAVLCADGRLFATTDAATTWSPPVTVAGMVTLTATPTGFSAVTTAVTASSATADPATCAGVNLVALNADLVATVTGCYETDETPAALAGNVAVAVADDTLWLWIGDATVRSTDAGRTWL
ncbi:hypothetical protein [Cryobacterium sp. PH31-O1]|uniref:hypothetical protein n=1 Tax=Cryobacterium sp. PH31-O1 TaxID=3046306 RepID=UPI0024B9C7A7|nr:hypothetical protein [Cryobacterium sp. PH31-O1]MDJ0338402.1 hypothetical protein [Cryobacterium sp. PH31-O1]